MQTCFVELFHDSVLPCSRGPFPGRKIRQQRVAVE